MWEHSVNVGEIRAIPEPVCLALRQNAETQKQLVMASPETQAFRAGSATACYFSMEMKLFVH
jgi:hypothetical protein